MKKKWGALALAGMLVLAGCSNKENSEPIAKVNGVAITDAEYESQLDMYANMLAVQYNMPQTIQNLLIQDVLIRQDMEKNKVEVSKERYAEDLTAEKTKMGGEEAYQKMLKSYRISDDVYKKSLENETRFRVHREWFNTQNTVSQEEIDKYYETNKNSLTKYDIDQIVVLTQDEANKVKERLDKGEDFATVAKEVSIDQETHEKGGKLGSVLASAMVSKYGEGFNDAVLVLEKGATSGPIQSPIGFHIVRLNDKSETVDQLKTDITDALNQTKYTEYLTKLRNDAKIELPGQEEPQATIYEQSTESSESTKTE